MLRLSIMIRRYPSAQPSMVCGQPGTAPVRHRRRPAVFEQGRGSGSIGEPPPHATAVGNDRPGNPSGRRPGPRHDDGRGRNGQRPFVWHRGPWHWSQPKQQRIVGSGSGIRGKNKSVRSTYSERRVGGLKILKKLPMK